MRRRWSAAADEQRFRDDVKTGDTWVRKIAARLRVYGFWKVQTPDVRVRGAFEDRGKYRDDGDLFLNGKRIEVRSFGFRFTGPEDFPRREVQVELAKVAGAKRNAVAYLFVSRQTQAVVGLVGCDMGQLRFRGNVWNQRRGVARDWMVAPSEQLLAWPQVVNYLAEKCRATC